MLTAFDDLRAEFYDRGPLTISYVIAVGNRRFVTPTSAAVIATTCIDFGDPNIFT
ncbi:MULTISPECIES: hypothetical protein [unclassified Rhodococcus (in: high G+C Gram-positive bacteria)]|uniref:hypothetical protein n=1 Tax=unclassified Rhodococcus (in: high G+C Gram-positive bacteria) TaxID=192944 RepID=UPI001639AE3A|nr:MULTISPECIES: hypothetical protein [unclassified Rhodococcus (in: high G+C Gram-positive bacteria)]MBC2641224.1 hypothetical protein [Rhodococcus sp. 3A]MBC2894030.1 hypothetical protein [Rhodococcus sp. 4CII]